MFSAPSAHFSYDLWHILTLNYMPSMILVERPFLEMVIDEKGAVVVKTQGASAHNFDVSLFKKMLERVLAIRELNIADAHFRLKDDRFKLFVQENIGVSATRNRGIEEANYYLESMRLEPLNF